MGTNTEDAIKRSDVIKRRIDKALFALLSALFAISIFAYIILSKEDGKLLVVALFLIPLTLLVFFLWRAGDFAKDRELWVYLVATCLFLIVCMISWLLYSLHLASVISISYFPRLSILCTTCACGLSAIAFATTRSIMHPRKGSVIEKWFREHTFVLLCGFLGIFLCITFLFSFALAFHDKAERKNGSEALHAVAVSSPAFSKKSIPHEENGIGMIFFKEGSAIVDVDWDIVGRKYAEATNILEKRYEGDTDKHDRIRKNNETMNDIMGQIKHCGLNTRIRVTLLGHSDDMPVSKSRYLSNYELAEARAYQTYLTLMEKLDEPAKETIEGSNNPEQESATQYYNIEWQVLSISNEKKFISTTMPANERCVEVLVKPIPRHLTQLHIESLSSPKPSLLDYIYFTIYTITTTGYGDFMPITGYARFIVSLANLVELFFLVIFFNVLVSPRLPLPEQIPDLDDVVERNVKAMYESRRKQNPALSAYSDLPQSEKDEYRDTFLELIFRSS